MVFWGAKFPIVSQLEEMLFIKTIQRFSETGKSRDCSRRRRSPTSTAKENVKIIADGIRRNPQRFVRKMSREMSINRTSLRRIIGVMVKLYAYKKGCFC